MAAEEQVIERKTAVIDGELIAQAKLVASHERITLAEVLERHIRPGLSRDVQRVAAELTKSTTKAGA
jgi:hypothetical protein